MSQKFVSASMLNYSVQKVIGLINGKVDKVEGKGLSTNDLTEALKANYDAAYTHISNKENPHGVTAEQVGLGNVPNVTTDDQTPTFTPATTLEALVSGEKLSVSMGKMAKAISDEIAHFANKENPHEVTVDQIGALAKELKGAANGLAELDENGLVPTAQLPSYVDDVVEVYLADGKAYKEAAHTTEVAGEAGKIYVDMADGKTYRWSGSAFVEISASLALGETSSTAFRGDLGKIAYEHSQASHARTDATKVEASSTNGNIKINGTETPVYVHPIGTNPHGTTKSDVGLGNVDNTADIDKSVAHATTTGGLKTAVKINGVEFDGTKDIEVPVLGIVDSALKDGKGQEIATTYIKNLDMSNNAIIFTKGDGTTKTFTAYVHPNTLGNLHVPEGTTDAKSNGYVLRCNVAGYPVWEPAYDYIPNGPEGSYEDKPNTKGSDESVLDSNKASSAICYSRTFKVFEGSTETKNGKPGFVPAPEMSSDPAYLRNDGTWEQFQTISTNDIDSMFEGTYQTN